MPRSHEVRANPCHDSANFASEPTDGVAWYVLKPGAPDICGILAGVVSVQWGYRVVTFCLSVEVVEMTPADFVHIFLPLWLMALAVWALASFVLAFPPWKRLKGLTAIPLLFVHAVCVWGFIASLEPGDHLPWRIGYAAVGLLCLALAVYMTLHKGNKEVL